MESAQRMLKAVDQLIEQRHLLKHPFYQTWVDGKLTLDSLRGYARQYYRQVEAFPLYLGAVYARCEDVDVRRKVLANLIEEDWGEENHPELWLRFAEGLGLRRQEVLQAEALAETAKSVETLRRVTLGGEAAAGMAAIYAYEAMVPEVAETKITGLRKFYGIEDERTLSFFVVHESADRLHREWDRDVLRQLCDSSESAEACEKAAGKALDSLWMLLDGVHREYVSSAACS